jgi:hypothetical protein
MSIDLNDPVFYQDVKAEEEYSAQGWKVFYDFYCRLSAQGAPAELVAKVVEINNLYKEMNERITAIKPFFPVETER